MKQKLILFLIALLGTVGVWATDISVGASTGTFYNSNGSALTPGSNLQYGAKWVSSHESGLTLACSRNNMIISTSYGTATSLNLHTDPQNYTLSVSDAYVITGYSITAYAGNGTSTINGTTVGKNADEATTVTVTDLGASSATIVIGGTANPWMYITDFTVSLELPSTTVDVTYVQYVNGEPTGITQKETVLPNSTVSIPSSLVSGYSSLAYDITTDGSIGEEDATVKVNINTKAGVVEQLSSLSNSKAYTIQCDRGYYTTNNGSLANTVKSSGYVISNFAIISYEKQYFLWSVEEGKFVQCNAAQLGDTPVAVTMVKVANGLFKFQGGGLTMNATSGFATGGGFDSWTTTDAGNSCVLIEAADFDATTALNALDDFFHPSTLVTLSLAVNITGTTEAENTRLGKITTTLGTATVSKYLYADTETQVLEGFLANTFTATATSYRGYEFTGFTIGNVDYGTSIEAGELSSLEADATLVANYTASTGNGINLWDDYTDDGSAAYRIPAITRTQSGRIIAFSDIRPGHTDVGSGATSIERRYSDDDGKTWSPVLCIAQGNWSESAANYMEWAFGDAAVVADNTPGNSGKDVLMICAAGNKLWPNSVYNPDNQTAQLGIARFRSTDAGETWSTYTDITPAIMQAFVDAGLRAADGSSGIVRAFFTSGKITQSVRKAEGAQYNRLYSAVDIPDQNVVVYSDDFGATWNVLGGQVANQGDEAHVIELPDGDLLLVGRGNSSRWVNVFNYADFNTAAGQWGPTGQWNNAAATSCNGDIEMIEAYDAYGEKNTVLVESAPMTSSPQRRDNQYYFIALPKATGFTTTDFSTVGGASWTQGMNISHNWGAYSSLLNLGDGNLDILYEDCAKDETVRPTGYCIVYERHNVKDITLGQYFADKAQAEAEGVKTPRPGHFYRFKSTKSDACLAVVDGAVKVAEADNASTLWYYGTDGLVSYATGQYLDCNAKGLAPVGTSYKAAITPNSYHEGKYTIQTNSRYCYHRDSNGTIDRGQSYNNDEGYAWIAEDVTALPVTVSHLGLATLYSPVDLTVPEGVKVYAATKNEAYSSIHFDEVEAVKAATGVLLEAEAGTYYFTVAGNEADYTSDLTGSVATVAKSSIAATVYTLQSGPAFKQYTGENVTGFRSHIEAEAAGVKAFNMIFNDETGINAIDNEQLTNDNAIYNLSGQRMSRFLKGINIINGKKIIK